MSLAARVGRTRPPPLGSCDRGVVEGRVPGRARQRGSPFGAVLILVLAGAAVAKEIALTPQEAELAFVEGRLDDLGPLEPLAEAPALHELPRLCRDLYWRPNPELREAYRSAKHVWSASPVAAQIAWLLEADRSETPWPDHPRYPALGAVLKDRQLRESSRPLRERVGGRFLRQCLESRDLSPALRVALEGTLWKLEVLEGLTLGPDEAVQARARSIARRNLLAGLAIFVAFLAAAGWAYRRAGRGGRKEPS